MKYDIKQDHTDIKQQIKEWELELNAIHYYLMTNETYEGNLLDDLESVVDEMMAVNI